MTVSGDVRDLDVPRVKRESGTSVMEPGTVRTATGVFAVDVHSETLREALVAIGTRGGWAFAPRPISGACVVLDCSTSEQVGVGGARVILVADPQPASARSVLEALESGKASAAFLSDEPGDLLPALNAARSGWSSAPARLVEIAAKMPELSDRQVAVIRAVMAGQDNHAIAQGLCLSSASVKRELGGLFRSLRLGSRLALSAEGAALGLTPRRAVT